MVDHVVLHVPHKMIRAQQADGRSGNAIPSLVRTEAAMAAIVHNIETNPCYQSTQHHTFTQSQVPDRCEKNKVNKYGDETQYHQQCFGKEPGVTCGIDPFFVKISLYTLLQFSMQGFLNSREFGNNGLRHIQHWLRRHKVAFLFVTTHFRVHFFSSNLLKST